MLDTIAIKITYPSFMVGNPNLFTPALNINDKTTDFNFGRHKFQKFVQNATMADKQAGIYLPRLTVYKRFEDYRTIYDLHIEFSVPKLLNNNSVQEYDEADFDQVISILKVRLAKMEIRIFEALLQKAIVVKAHFAKNIVLPSPMTVQDAISTLYKADIGKTKDVNIRHYGNNGQALYFYASSANIIFYDKLKDLQTPKAKAIDKDKHYLERLFTDTWDGEQKPEILRYEIRLAKQQSLIAFLSKIKGEKIKHITFEELFKKELWQKALLAKWSEIIKSPASQLAFKLERPTEEVFDAMIAGLTSKRKKQAHSLNTALASLGLFVLINQYGVRKTRDKIEKNWTSKSWTRLSDKIKISASTLRGTPPSLAISEIQSALEKFERYDFKQD
jgi:hypothetical protein